MIESIIRIVAYFGVCLPIPQTEVYTSMCSKVRLEIWDMNFNISLLKCIDLPSFYNLVLFSCLNYLDNTFVAWILFSWIFNRWTFYISLPVNFKLLRIWPSSFSFVVSTRWMLDKKHEVIPFHRIHFQFPIFETFFLFSYIFFVIYVTKRNVNKQNIKYYKWPYLNFSDLSNCASKYFVVT